jgi:hypothetical protein
MGDVEKSIERAEILLEALPYIRRFYNKPLSSNTAGTLW